MLLDAHQQPYNQTMKDGWCRCHGIFSKFITMRNNIDRIRNPDLPELF